MAKSKKPLMFIKFLVVTVIAARHECDRNPDCIALLALRDSVVVGGAGSNTRLAWNYTQSGSVCSWDAVSCDESARVQTLDLHNLALYGTLPPQIGLLDHVGHTFICFI